MNLCFAVKTLFYSITALFKRRQFLNILSCNQRAVHFPYGVFLVVLFLYSPVFAGETLPESHIMDELIVTGSRIPRLLSETGQSLSIISREDIEILPASTVSELLDTVGGVDVRHRGVKGSQTDVSIWGSSYEQVLILIDGINVSDPQTGHHNMDLPVNLNDIERIEILKGPGARIYGQNAMAGVINIITRSPEHHMINGSLSYGSYDYYQTQASINGKLGPLSNRLSASRRATDGHKADKPTDSQTNTFTYRGDIKNPQHELQLGAGFTDKDFGAYKFYTDVYPDQHENTKTALLYANDRFYLSDVEIMTSLSWRRHEDEFHILIGDTWYTNEHKNNTIGLQINSKFSSCLGTSVMGGETAFENLDSSNLGDHDRERNGLYFEHQIDYANHFIMGFGTSAIRYSDWGWQHWPGANLNIKVANGLNLFSSIGKSFRVPTYTELYYSTPANQGNPDLEIEKAWTYEAGINLLTHGLHARVSLFIRDTENLIDWTRAEPVDPWQVTNVAEVKTRGCEFEVEAYPGLLADILHQTTLKLSYTYIDTDRDTQGFESKYALDNLTHQFKGLATIDWLKNLSHSIALRYEKRLNNEAYALVDSRITGRWNKFRYYLDVSNIFNKHYISNGFAKDPGRWVIIGLSYETHIL